MGGERRNFKIPIHKYFYTKPITKFSKDNKTCEERNRNYLVICNISRVEKYQYFFKYTNHYIAIVE